MPGEREKDEGWALRLRAWLAGPLVLVGILLSGGTAAGSEIVFSGQVGVTARTTESDVTGDSQQFGVTTNIDGKGYIWRPWFSTLGLKLYFTQNTSGFDRNDAAASQSTKDQLFSGELRLNFLPQSRYPSEVFIDIYDSRIETDSVGVALDDITTLRRERIGVTQQYRTTSGLSNYGLQAVRTHILGNDATQENILDALTTGAQRSTNQSFDYRVSHRDSERTEPNARHTQDLDGITMRHEYRASETFTVETVADSNRDGQRVDGINARQSTATSMDNFVTWRSKDAKWTARTHLGVQQRETQAAGADTQQSGQGSSQLSNGSARLSYNVTSTLRATGEAGVNRTRTNDAPEVEQRFETATLDYTPIPVTVSAGIFYHWSASTSVGTTDSSTDERIDTRSLNIQHGVDRIVSNDQGRTVTMAVSQGATKSQDSRGADLLTLLHQGSAAVQWTRYSNTTRVQTTLSDSQTSGTRAEATQGDQKLDPEVSKTTKTIDVRANHQFQITRQSSWDGDARSGATNETDGPKENRTRYTNLSAGYNYNHIFRVDRLRFRSRLEYGWQRTESNDHQVTDNTNVSKERGSWDNRLDYSIGLLTLGLRRTVTEADHKRTTITAVSANRAF